jgi:hypothetical protein
MSAQNIEMTQGETYTATCTVTTAAGVAQPLAGYTVRYEAETPVRIVKDLDDAKVVLSATPGVFTFTILPADTEDLDIEGKRAYPHECRVMSPTDEVTVVFTGMLVLTEAVIAEMDPT